MFSFDDRPELNGDRMPFQMVQDFKMCRLASFQLHPSEAASLLTEVLISIPVNYHPAHKDPLFPGTELH